MFHSPKQFFFRRLLLVEPQCRLTTPFIIAQVTDVVQIGYVTSVPMHGLVHVPQFRTALVLNPPPLEADKLMMNS